MKNVLLLRIVFICMTLLEQKYYVKGTSKEIDILWNKYGDLRADVETLKAQVHNNLDTNAKINNLEEEVQDLKHELDSIKEYIHQPNRTQHTNITEEDVFKTLDWQLHKSSIRMKAKGDGVVFSLEYSSSENIPVDWFVDRMIILDGNVEYSKSSYQVKNNFRSVLTAHLPMDKIVRKLVTAYFIIPSQTSNLITTLTVSFNTLNVSERVDSGTVGMLYGVETSRLNDSLVKSFTVIPEFGDYEYDLQEFFCAYEFLKVSKNNYSIGYANTYLPKENRTITAQNITKVKGELKRQVTLNKTLETFGGDLLSFFHIRFRGKTISGLSLIFVVSNVFENSATVNNLQGKFALNDPIYANMKPDSNGLILCSGMGYPAPRLEIVKLINTDEKRVRFPFENQVKIYQRNHFSTLRLVIPNVTTTMGGDYACVGRVNEVIETKVFHINISSPAKFDQDATNVTISPNGKMSIHIAATGESAPQIRCMENENQGDDITYKYETYFTENFTEENKSVLSISFDSAMNGTTYGPLYKLVCSARNVNDFDADDWLTISL